MGFNRDIKIQRPTGRKLLLLVPFALCYACFVVLGDWQGSVGYSNAQNLGRLVLWAAGSFAVLFAAGFLLENWAVLIALMPSGARVVYEKMFPPRKARQGQWWIWLAFFMFCLLCYLPYFLIYYPTWFNNDAVWQVEQALGMAAKSNHHPYFHTLIIKVFLTVGYGLFHDYTAAVAFLYLLPDGADGGVFSFICTFCTGGARGFYGLFSRYFSMPFSPLMECSASVWARTRGLRRRFCSLCGRYTTVRQRQGLPGHRACGGGSAFFVTGVSVCLLRSNGIFVFLGTAVLLVISQIFPGERRTGLKGRVRGKRRR